MRIAYETPSRDPYRRKINIHKRRFREINTRVRVRTYSIWGCASDDGRYNIITSRRIVIIKSLSFLVQMTRIIAELL